MHLVGFIIKIHHDARSSQFQSEGRTVPCASPGSKRLPWDSHGILVLHIFRPVDLFTLRLSFILHNGKDVWEIASSGITFGEQNKKIYLVQTNATSYCCNIGLPTSRQLKCLFQFIPHHWFKPSKNRTKVKIHFCSSMLYLQSRT